MSTFSLPEFGDRLVKEIKTEHPNWKVSVKCSRRMVKITVCPHDLLITRLHNVTYTIKAKTKRCGKNCRKVDVVIEFSGHFRSTVKYLLSEIIPDKHAYSLIPKIKETLTKNYGYFLKLDNIYVSLAPKSKDDIELKIFSDYYGQVGRIVLYFFRFGFLRSGAKKIKLEIEYDVRKDQISFGLNFDLNVPLERCELISDVLSRIVSSILKKASSRVEF